MTESIKSIPSPIVTKPDVKIPKEEQQTNESLLMNEMNKDLKLKAETLQSIGNVSKTTLKTLTGLLANVASVGIDEKVDSDKNIKQRYRSTKNFSENEDIAKAIAQQKEELENAKNEKTWKSLTDPRNYFSEDDIMSIINETNDELQNKIFGPLWENWTNGEDFIGDLKNSLENIVNLFEPIMDLIDQLQEYINGSVANSLEKYNIDNMYTSKRTGEKSNLPLGVIAIEALNTIIGYIRNLISNLEYISEQYTNEELKTLLSKGTSGANYGTLIKTIQDLIQLIVNCIKPYVHNLIMALICDAIDFVVDKLDKAGILSPEGPLKLIPIAITLVRAILRGDLEAIEEMVKKSVTKIINLILLAGIATKDPSILWADTYRLDKEIAVARYNEMTDDGKKPLENKDKFLNRETSENKTAAFRHFFQKMKGETQETFNQYVNLATTYSDLNLLYKKKVSTNAKIKQNNSTTEEKLKEASERMSIYDNSIGKEIKEKNYP